MSFGREPVTVVDFIQDFCDKEYGVTCNAVLGVTGDQKCFNTFRTCQDSANYNKVTDGLTLRFCRPVQEIPLEWKAIPSLTKVSVKPTLLNVGGGNQASGPLGERGSCTITFQDHPDGDIKTDPYLSDRNYDPFTQGTFWTKWIARNAYYKNRLIKIYQGFLDQNLEDMKVSFYYINKIQGPDSSGKVKVMGTDILRLIDDDKTKVPIASSGELTGDINATQTSFTVGGALDGDYDAVGTIRIGDEIITYTSAVFSGVTYTFSGCVRGAEGSEADSHDAEDRVQRCIRYTDELPHDVAYDLLVNEGPIPAAAIPYTDWDTEAAIWLPQFSVSTIISEPTGIKNLIGSLTKECMFYIWWDEREAYIKLRAVRPPDEDPVLWDLESTIIAGSQTSKEAPEQRASRVYVYYQPINWAEDLEKESNFRRVRLSLDLASESDNEYGEKQIHPIYCRFIRTDGQALNLGERFLAKYRDTPKFLSLRVDGDNRDTWTSDIVSVESDLFVNFIGEKEAKQFQVISAEEVKAGEVIEYNLQTTTFIGGTFAYYMEDNAPDYINATLVERRTGAWYADVDGLLPDGSDGYTYQ